MPWKENKYHLQSYEQQELKEYINQLQTDPDKCVCPVSFLNCDQFCKQLFPEFKWGFKTCFCPDYHIDNELSEDEIVSRLTKVLKTKCFEEE